MKVRLMKSQKLKAMIWTTKKTRQKIGYLLLKTVKIGKDHANRFYKGVNRLFLFITVPYLGPVPTSLRLPTLT